MGSRVRFNLNDSVYVRLTPHALAHIQSLHKPEYWPHVKPKVDAQGYSEIQTWKFIEYFGHLFGLGQDVALWFEDGMDVQFSRADLKRVNAGGGDGV